MNAILSEKGQVTIPKRLREDLGLIPGSVLDFREEDGTLVVKKVLAENPVRTWRGKGKLPRGGSVDAYLNRIRDGE